MSNLQKTILQRLFILAVALSAFTASITAAAVPHVPSPALHLGADFGIRIKIVIIIIIKKNNVVELAGTRLAGAGEKLGANEFSAEVERNGGQLSLKIDDPRFKAADIVVKDGFRVSSDVSRQIGSNSLKLKAGKVALSPNKMGNFEIQD
ncbi:MAG: hypothetical protein KDC80_17525 [Saprospiraceae bacterium]|nr:hypothetical protein [Saprospiraceae bacterium]